MSNNDFYSSWRYPDTTASAPTGANWELVQIKNVGSNNFIDSSSQGNEIYKYFNDISKEVLYIPNPIRLVGNPLYNLPFTDGSGQQLTDLTGNLSAYLGSTETTDGDDPSWDTFGLDLDDGHQITLADDGLTLFDTQTYTLGLVINFTALVTNTYIFSYDFTSHTNPFYSIHLRVNGSGNIFWGWNNSGTYTSGVTNLLTGNGAVTTDTWYHIIIKMTPGDQQIKINDSTAASKSVSHTINFYSQPVWIGLANPGDVSNFNIAYFYFYDEFLTSQQDTDNHNNLQQLLASRGITLG